MPSDFANTVLAQLLSEFIAKHPAIQLELDLSPRRVDLIGENFDLAVRMGELPDDSQLVARRIAEMTVSLYAAPAYLAQVGEPRHPDELLALHGLLLLGRGGEARPWRLERGPAVSPERW